MISIRSIRNSSPRFASDTEIFDDINTVFFDLGKVGNHDYKLEAAGIPIYSKAEDKGMIVLDTSEKHVIMYGASGSGKSTLSAFELVLSIAAARESAVVTDPKGEIYQRLYPYINDRVNVKVMNFRDPHKSTHAYDLLYELKHCDVEKREHMAKELAQQIIFPKNILTKDEFWNKSALAICQGILLLMFDIFDIDDPRFCLKQMIHLIKVGFSKASELSSGYIIKPYFDQKENAESAAGKLIADVLSTAKETAAGIISTLNSQLNDYFANGIVDILSQADWIAENLIKEPTILFIIIPDESSAHDAVIKLVLKDIYTGLTRIALKEGNLKLSRRVNFVLDEFANLRWNCTDLISVCRSRNIRFIMYVQSHSQLIENLGRNGAESLLTNTDIKMYLHSNELMLTNTFSELCGTVKSPYTGERKPLVSAFMLRHLPFGVMLMLNSRKYPFFSQLDTWNNIEKKIACKDFDKKSSICSLPVFEPKKIDEIDVKKLARYGCLKPESAFEGVRRKPGTKAAAAFSKEDADKLNILKLEAKRAIEVLLNKSEKLRAEHNESELIERRTHYVFFYQINTRIAERVRQCLEELFADKEKVAKILEQGYFSSSTFAWVARVMDKFEDSNIPYDKFMGIKHYELKN